MTPGARWRGRHLRGAARGAVLGAVLGAALGLAALLAGAPGPAAQAQIRPATAADLAAIREVQALNQASMAARQAGRYADALDLARRALERGRTVLPPDSRHMHMLGSNLAVIMVDNGRYREAADLLRAILSAQRRSLPPDDPDLLEVMNGLAGALHALGEYEEAERLHREALAARERRLGLGAEKTIQSLNNLGGLLEQVGRVDEAEAIYRDALARLERDPAASRAARATLLNNLGALRLANGRFGEAEELLRRAIALREQDLGADHPETLTSVGSLGVLLFEIGRLSEAEAHLRRAHAGLRAASGPTHPATLMMSNNLASVLYRTSRESEAEAMLRFAVEQGRALLGESHPNVLTFEDNLALLLQATDRIDEALALNRSVHARKSAALGPGHYDTLTSLGNLAGAAARAGRDVEAERLYRDALALGRETFGPAHPRTLSHLNNLAVFLQASRRDGEAETLFVEARRRAGETLSPAHPMVIQIELNYATLLASQRRWRQALAALEKVGVDALAWIEAELAETGEANQRRLLLGRQSSYPSMALSVALEIRTPRAARLAAETVLGWKRLTGEEEATVARFAMTSAAPEVVTAARAVAARRADLMAALGAEQGELDAKRALEAAERRLAALSSEYAALERQRRAGLDDVRAALPRSAALVEFRVYDPFDFAARRTRPRRLMAVVIQKDRPPALVDLGALDAIEREVLGATDFEDRARRRAMAEALGQRLLAPLLAHLDGVETLYLSPDGPLHLAAFDMLPLPDGRYLIEAFETRIVSSGRALVRGAERLEARAMIALGGADFDLAGPGAPTRPSAEALSAARDGESARGVYRSRIAFDAAEASRASGLARFAPLPETAREVETLTRLWSERTGWFAQGLVGDAAREGLLRAAVQSPRVLHIATHGFYLPSPERARAHPMALAGLALSGANHGLAEDRPAEEDGVLWALEAMSLPLAGAELVALSACDTAKGVLDAAEGVYGLGRAFQIAGARNVLLTLWALNDARARRFMEAFYERWLSGAYEGPADALHATKLDWARADDPARSDTAVWAPYFIVQNGR